MKIEDFLSQKEIRKVGLDVSILDGNKRSSIDKLILQGKELLKIKTLWYKEAKYTYPGNFKEFINEITGIDYSWATRLMKGAQLYEPGMFDMFKDNCYSLGYSLSIEDWINFIKGRKPSSKRKTSSNEEDELFFLRHFQDHYQIKVRTNQENVEVQVIKPNGIKASAEETYEYLYKRMKNLK